jgi:phosphoribosylanthranilate isomerase
VRPFGVDVSSGVEESPGRKNPHLIQSFVTTARAAFARNA